MTAESDTDLRETVFECCVKHQIVLLEMTSLTRSLEDVFLELTGGKEAQ